MSRLILVVEDEADNRRILRDLLTSSGFRVAEADNGPDGLEMTLRERPDLVIMDIRLPGMDGFEVTRLIKSRPEVADTPVIIVTSHAMSDDTAKALAAGGDAYFSKPVSPRALLAKIKEFLP